MASAPRQRAFLAARVAAVLAAVAVVLLLASRTHSNPQDMVPPATTHPPVATHAVARAATGAAAGPVQVIAERSLCQAVPRLVQVSIQVLGSPHQGGAINVSNAGTVTKVGQVRSLAGLFCALPALPAKPESCPAVVGEWFQLIFGGADGEFWTVWASNGGCEQVIGVGDLTRTATPAGPHLWPALLADLRGSQPG
jgi:hypothetical protein